MTSHIHSLTFDCADPEIIAHFWAKALGYLFEGGDDYGTVIVDPAGIQPRLLFLIVPEGKTAKNRLHFDLQPAGSMNEEVDRLKGLGATEVMRFFDEENGHFTGMRDPEGNEFCVELSQAERSK